MSAPAFDPQPTLIGETLELRPLAAGDLDGLHAAASDEETWAGHPAKDRWKREMFEPYFAFLLRTGTTLAIIDRASGAIIGASRYYTAPDMPGSISIGFTFLNHRWWGGRTNFELKRLMLGHAFASFPSVWFHIDPSNIRSQTATARLGAVHAYDATLELIPGRPAPWVVLRLDRSAWDRVCAERAGPGPA
ncbi:GNAT family N-acetyltransferase [Amaricoccus sp.]|uniref:GNAT family N-acetyltransferase n=1 Tax=Amaricoccus sp. TaxID=1872485 RepID=UPI001B6085D2|nr:GNAT family N-acetyltransferase [Amaricoccus sp.]MBP7242919.1 GNAT family N-acetyltransferase [Amaricoccus sp.]